MSQRLFPLLKCQLSASSAGSIPALRAGLVTPNIEAETSESKQSLCFLDLWKLAHGRKLYDDWHKA